MDKSAMASCVSTTNDVVLVVGGLGAINIFACEELGSGGT